MHSIPEQKIDKCLQSESKINWVVFLEIHTYLNQQA